MDGDDCQLLIPSMDAWQWGIFFVVSLYCACRLQGGNVWIHSHAPSITRIHHLLRQLHKWLSNKRPASIEDCRCALDIVPVLILHLLHHAFYALGVGDIGRYADCFTAGVVNGVDDGDVGVWVAGEENDGVGGGEFAGDGCAGLWLLRLVFMAEKRVEGGRWRGTYAWTDAGDDGDCLAGHGADVGDDGEETGGGVHELYNEGRGNAVVFTVT